MKEGHAPLRAATPADLDALVRHRRRMWEDMGTLAPGAPDASERAYRDWLAPRLASGEVVGWLAQDAAGPVASGLLWFQDWHPRPTVPRGTIPYLLSFFVEPRARGQGLARAMVESGVKLARAAGHPRVALHASEAGRPLYAALGFKPSTEMWLEVAR